MTEEIKKWGKKEGEKEINVQMKDRKWKNAGIETKGKEDEAYYFSSTSMYQLHTLDWLEASLI
jgi:hypothetical protein